jgi:hypothetical protein
MVTVSTVELGDQVRDKVTGFKGIVTGKAQYLTGCKQVMVTPKVGDDGKYVDACWLDVDRVEILGKEAIKIDVVDNGGPQQSPSRR